MKFDISDQKSMKTFIERRHPDYERLAPHWAFLEACYEGGRDWFADNIFPYYKEGEGEYQSRIVRAFRFNHSREIVDLVNKYIFKSKIERDLEDASPAVKKFWERSTRNGLNIDQYMRQVSQRLVASGWLLTTLGRQQNPRR